MPFFFFFKKEDVASDESLKEFEGATLRYASINLRYKINLTTQTPEAERYTVLWHKNMHILLHLWVI